MLTLYGKPGSSYAVESKTNLAAPTWQPRWNVPLTNLSHTMAIGNEPGLQFYRAYEFFADPPILQLSRSASSNRLLLLYGRGGTNYSIEGTTNLGHGWAPFTSLTLTNSFQFIDQDSATNRQQFYRAWRP
jgi:hypothetical protein